MPEPLREPLAELSRDEVEPAAGRQQEYLDLAAALRPELEKIDGFISIERFSSLTKPGKILSLSFWRDDAAIAAFAAVQVVVHMVYFLHMNGKIEGGWNLMAALFTILLVAIILSGTLWVMFHLNANMMPVKMDGMG